MSLLSRKNLSVLIIRRAGDSSGAPLYVHLFREGVMGYEHIIVLCTHTILNWCHYEHTPFCSSLRTPCTPTLVMTKKMPPLSTKTLTGLIISSAAQMTVTSLPRLPGSHAHPPW